MPTETPQCRKLPSSRPFHPTCSDGPPRRRRSRSRRCRWHLAAAYLVVLLSSSASTLVANEAAAPRHFETQLLIVGGTESGWAAAIQAARMGVGTITIVHDGRWLGGQYTEQALACVDENKGVGRVGFGVPWHPMKRSFYRSGLFLELMDEIEAVNRAKYGSPMPGRPYHGPSTFRPVEAEAAFRKLLQPYIDSGQVELFTEYIPIEALTDGPRRRLRGVSFVSTTPERPRLNVTAELTIDASDWGEVIQLAGAEFYCGPDPRARFGEPSAPESLDEYPPNEMNPITWAMIVEQTDNAKPLERPAHFDDRNYVRTSRLSLAELKDLEWDRPVRLGSILHWPPAGAASPRQLSVYNVRRLVDGYTSHTGRTLILLNYMLGQDYPLERLPQRVVEALEATEPGASQKNIVLMNRQQREIVFADARQHALGVLYHLQNFVHERASDKTHSFRHFELSNEFGTPDRLPPKPYIRESLRLSAMYMMREQDSRNLDGGDKTRAREAFARAMYPDGVFAWQFHYDFHRTGRAYLQTEGNRGPWIDFEKPGRHTHFVSDRSVFPLRSLVPIRVDGLLGAQKNVGYSSIVSAAIRLHDQCVHIGQAAGATAAICLERDLAPREVPLNRKHLASVRSALCGSTADSVPLLLWPFRDLTTDHPAFVAINQLAVRNAFPLDRRAIDFGADQPASSEWRAAVVERSLANLTGRPELRPPEGELTRGEFARLWWEQIKGCPEKPFHRLSDRDADGDGIEDHQDPLPFDADNRTLPEPPRSPETDGLPDPLTPDPLDPDSRFAPGSERIVNFSRQKSAATEDLTDHGLAFDEQRGYGWRESMQANFRTRNALPEDLRDSFAFTRDQARWEWLLPSGRYLVTVCIGDASFPQNGQQVTVEGSKWIDNVDTASGWFLERTAEVQIEDGRLTVDLGPQAPACNTCLNWVRVVRLK